MHPSRLLLLLCVLGVYANTAQTNAGTVSSPYLYAWSNNSGYINFSNATITNTQLSGYAWSANYGWINLSPAQGGVSNDGTGNLSGSAWGTQLGWIDFDGVSIDGSTGRFSGTATGTIVGTLTFDCPTYCDVRTDWRSAATILSENIRNPRGTGIDLIGLMRFNRGVSLYPSLYPVDIQYDIPKLAQVTRDSITKMSETELEGYLPQNTIIDPMEPVEMEPTEKLDVQKTPSLFIWIILLCIISSVIHRKNRNIKSQD